MGRNNQSLNGNGVICVHQCPNYLWLFLFCFLMYTTTRDVIFYTNKINGIVTDYCISTKYSIWLYWSLCLFVLSISERKSRGSVFKIFCVFVLFNTV
jgi:hypothetical protein